jgi:hypothetical protein
VLGAAHFKEGEVLAVGTPRKNLARSTARKSLSPAQAKPKVLDLIAQGFKVAEAMAAVDRTVNTYRDWYKEDSDFAEQVKYLRDSSARARAGGVAPVPDFPEFAAEYLHQPLGPHHMRMYDVLQGREPRDLHPAMTFVQGRSTRLLMNLPPDHGKSTTWTVNYVTWLIHKNPNIRVVIVSKTQPMAKKFLGAIKNRLISPMYREMHLKFAPEGGWKDPDGSWTTTEIYVKGRENGEKDPTVQALGVGGQIYGTRADVIILDDVADLASAGRYDWMEDWIGQDVDSRLGDTGVLLVAGTRVAPVDIYQRLKSDDYIDEDGTPVWTYFAQPAVLEYAASSKDWVTLWPALADGKPKYPGPALAKKKAVLRNERHWQLVYQQADVAETAIFPPEAIQCSIDRMRWHGPLKAGVPGHREEGMRGLYVIGGVDPATVGHTAMLVIGVDRRTQKRWVLDGFDQAMLTPHQLREKIKHFTVEYGVKKWVVERNAFQAYLTRDEELLQWLYANGSQMKEHYTHGNKYDPDFGVASMAPLFLSCGSPQPEGRPGWKRTIGGGLVELPNPTQCLAIQTLTAQLAIWQPEGMKRGDLQDMVMAFWFCEIGAREYLGVGRNNAGNHLDNPFLSKRDHADRQVLDLNELEAAFLMEADSI